VLPWLRDLLLICSDSQGASSSFGDYLEWMMPACLITATSCPALVLPVVRCQILLL